MKIVFFRAACLTSLVGLMSACAPTSDAPMAAQPAVQGPQYAPGDPCKGVVPQLCPR